MLSWWHQSLLGGQRQHQCSFHRLFREPRNCISIVSFMLNMERTFSSVLKRVETYDKNTTEQTRLSALASMVGIAKDVLLKRKCQDDLYRGNKLLLRKKKRIGLYCVAWVMALILVTQYTCLWCNSILLCIPVYYWWYFKPWHQSDGF